MTDFEEATQDWDNVQEVIPEFKSRDDNEETGPTDNVQPLTKSLKETPFISSSSALNHFKAIGLATPSLDEVSERLQMRKGSLQKMLCQPCYQLQLPNEDILNEMAFVMALAKSPFDNSDPVCFQILLTLYKQLTGDTFDCPRYGSHWEQIGFQGNDPATDLRGVGLLGLLQPLYALTNPKSVLFFQKLHKLSQKEGQDFPLMVLSINLTRITFDLLMDGHLKSFCQNGGGMDCMENLNIFYCAITYLYYDIWKTKHKTIKDSGYVLQDVEVYARKNSQGLLHQFENHLSTYSSEEIEVIRNKMERRM